MNLLIILSIEVLFLFFAFFLHVYVTFSSMSLYCLERKTCFLLLHATYYKKLLPARPERFDQI